MKQQPPVVERYMTHLETAISRLDPADRREILQDIRNHIAESTAAGKPLDIVLKSLGPADALGRAYAIELLLHPQKDRRNIAQRWFTLVGLLVVLGIPTLVAVTTLGSIGISFVAAGLFALVIGVLKPVLPWPNVTHLSPVMAILAGPILVVVGLISLMALPAYVRFAARAVQGALPSVRSAGRASESARSATWDRLRTSIELSFYRSASVRRSLANRPAAARSWRSSVGRSIQPQRSGPCTMASS